VSVSGIPDAGSEEHPWVNLLPLASLATEKAWPTGSRACSNPSIRTPWNTRAPS